ncbi:MAG: class I SAM-dependent methyltransferase [Polyangiaceae bacterium]|nr:class I SAM-dependent methyltransferase [Polyangiaceae bacterium]
MDRARVWPDFREAWILHEDADLVVIDKPAGVASQAADTARPDDVVTRLGRYLAGRGGDSYLGVHQRLDKDTSGVVVFARRREANARLAAQFERRRVEKTYVACVAGWPRGKDRATLRDTLAPGEGGSVQVVGMRPRSSDPAGRPRASGREAVTRVRVLSRRGDRAMLELVLETGRTHQARVQLAHAGAPIAGDPIYGGPPAPRLLLHACSLALEHPATGQRVTFRAPVPRELERWLDRGDPGVAVYDDAPALERALALALERRFSLGRSDGKDGATTAFRLVHEEGDALPRLAVDVYDAWLVAQFYGDDGPWADAERRDRTLDALAALGFDGVYFKVRPKQANVLVDTRRDDLAPRHPVRGQAAPFELTIHEEGVPLGIRLGDGLSTGIFLDQRLNRRRLRGLSSGKSVANVFAYTCGFTVAAALGGAVRTVSVDVAPAALERGRANLVLSGVRDLDRHAFVAADAFAWLAKAARRGETFDVVVLDPPSYSSTRRGRFVAESDYTALAASALKLLSAGGKLLACTNHRRIGVARFRRILFDACRLAGREPAQIKDLPGGPDFPPPPDADPQMKSALVTLKG